MAASCRGAAGAESTIDEEAHDRAESERALEEDSQKVEALRQPLVGREEGC